MLQQTEGNIIMKTGPKVQYQTHQIVTDYKHATFNSKITRYQILLSGNQIHKTTTSDMINQQSTTDY